MGVIHEFLSSSITALKIFITNMQNTLTVKVRLFSGIDKEANVGDYDRDKGLTLKVPKGTRLNKVVKMIGLSKQYTLVFFINGERAELWKKLEDGDEITLLRPAAGG